MTKEELEEKINAGDSDVINAYLAGEITIGEGEVSGEEGEVVAEVSEEEVALTIQEEVAVESVAEVVTEPVEEPQGVSKDDYDALVAKYKDEAKKRDDAIKQADAEKQRAKEAIERLESINKSSVAEQGGLKFETPQLTEDETDADLAGSYSKNNRAIIDTLKDTITGAASVDQVAALEQKLNSILEFEKDRREQQEAIAVKNAEDERKKKLFSEVDAFASGHEHFRMERGTAEVFNDVNTFKDRLKDYLRTSDVREVEKAYRNVVSGKDTELSENLSKAGVVVPNDAESYLRLAEVVDLKNGYKFNEYTGEYEQITDDFGVRVSQRSIEDAYKLSRFSDIVAEARAEQTQAIEEKLAGRQASATTLPQEVESDGSSDGQMSYAEMDQLLNLPDSAFRNNPALKAKLDAISQM